jgi:RNA polymerase sigma factor (sigma-70 family)
MVYRSYRRRERVFNAHLPASTPGPSLAVACSRIALYSGNVIRNDGKEITDSEAIARIVAGDSGAFRLVVERYEPAVRRLATRYLHDDAQVQDAVQEVFLKVFTSLRRFDPARRFFPWIYGIAVNHLRTLARRSARRRATEGPINLPLPSKGETPEEISIRRSDERLVRRAVAALPASLRDAVILYYLEQLSIDDVASALGLGRENVKSRLHRSRARLREFLSGHATD